MKEIKDLIQTVSERLTKLAKDGGVMAEPMSQGDFHVVPLCELSLGFGGGGGKGVSEGDDKGEGVGEGIGGGAGGGVSVRPVAVLVIDGDDIRLERLGA